MGADNDMFIMMLLLADVEIAETKQRELQKDRYRQFQLMQLRQPPSAAMRGMLTGITGVLKISLAAKRASASLRYAVSVFNLDEKYSILLTYIFFWTIPQVLYAPFFFTGIIGREKTVGESFFFWKLLFYTIFFVKVLCYC